MLRYAGRVEGRGSVGNRKEGDLEVGGKIIGKMDPGDRGRWYGMDSSGSNTSCELLLTR